MALRDVLMVAWHGEGVELLVAGGGCGKGRGLNIHARRNLVN